MQIFSATVNGELIGNAADEADALRQCRAWGVQRRLRIERVSMAPVLPADLALRSEGGAVMAWVCVDAREEPS